jgi:hypothetical protein
MNLVTRRKEGEAPPAQDRIKKTEISVRLDVYDKKNYY